MTNRLIRRIFAVLRAIGKLRQADRGAGRNEVEASLDRVVRTMTFLKTEIMREKGRHILGRRDRTMGCEAQRTVMIAK